MYFACDIGGTQMRIAKSLDLVKFDEPVIEATPKRPADGIQLLIETILRMAGGGSIRAVAIGIAGVLNEQHSMIIKSPHLGDWEKIPLKEKLERALNTEVFIENDTAIVGLGEAVAGAGRGYKNVVYMTISTGIGGVKIVNGEFEHNKFGFEPGHQILNNETGATFEDLCSGTSVEKKFGMPPKKVAQTDAWDVIETNTAIGVYNSILHWSPEVVVLGGSMSRDFNAERISKKLAMIMKIHPALPDIRISELGSIGGIHGGFAYLKKRVKK